MERWVERQIDGGKDGWIETDALTDRYTGYRQKKIIDGRQIRR